jgi:protein-tyrosine phosphatase
VSIERFAIHVVMLPGGGQIGLCRMPGQGGAFAADLAAMAAWSPRIVVSLTEAQELAAHGAAGIGAALAAQSTAHRHFPIVDYGAPEAGDAAWAALAAHLHAALDSGGRILVHCMGGCGRSGMIALRVMVERGEATEAALERLRAVRPCAVETAGQLAWAAHPSLRA